jgi:nucleotide sugar dehydrogenase
MSEVRAVGIVGNGFVGQAIGFGFVPVLPVYVHDKDPLRSMNTLEETVNESDIVFVSVPTPMKRDGSISLEIVRSVLNDISHINNRDDNVIVIKSTVIPGTTRSFSEEFHNLNLVFNPEFLTERHAKYDFLNQARIVLGGYRGHTQRVAELYRLRFKHCNIMETDFNTAEFIKYFNNVFFSVKVAFANEMKLIAENSGVHWESALAGFAADGRVGDSHLNVPGPDGKLGFGGSCFPKDINAFIDFANRCGVNANVVKAAWQTNLEVRPERDWENLKGRAIVEE